MDVEQLRRQAKELVRDARAGDARALARLDGREPILARAQLVIAREQGYASWPALVAAAEATVETFVAAATGPDGSRERAERLLAARPQVADDPWAALVLGRGEWGGEVHAPGGPRGWSPVLYAAHSHFAPVDALRDLLARGADPNATFRNAYGDMSALYGAAGVVRSAEMTRALLEAGADPDDGESVYHAAEGGSPACLRLLLDHGATVEGTNALGSVLDGERPEHLRLLLAALREPVDTQGALVAHALRRGLSVAVLEILADAGASLTMPGGETWRGPGVRRRTPYAHAVLRGRDDAAAWLAKRGAATPVDDADRAVAAVARGEAPGPAFPPEPDHDQQEVLILAALHGQLDAVVAAVGVGFAGVVGGSPRGTLLHHAAWVGDADAVRALVARGADVDAASGAEFDTPLDWLHLAVAEHGAWTEHEAARAALVDAGARATRPRPA